MHSFTEAACCLMVALRMCAGGAAVHSHAQSSVIRQGSRGGRGQAAGGGGQLLARAEACPVRAAAGEVQLGWISMGGGTAWLAPTHCGMHKHSANHFHEPRQTMGGW